MDDHSPSPGGEGRDEGERLSNLFPASLSAIPPGRDETRITATISTGKAGYWFQLKTLSLFGAALAGWDLSAFPSGPSD